MKKLQTGVYRWINRANGKRYVGGAYKSTFSLRRDRHIRQLRNGTHHSRHFQAAWNKYGEGAFVFRIIERCRPSKVRSREQYWMDRYKSYDPDYGYNVNRRADSSLGVKRSEETKAKLRGIVRTDETRAKLSAAHKGRVPWNRGKKGLQGAWNKGLVGVFRHTLEARRIMSAVRRGRVHTKKAKRKMSRSAEVRRKYWTVEQRKRLSLAVAESNRRRDYKAENRARGEHNGGGSKLTEKDVLWIRANCFNHMDCRLAAKKLGVGVTTVRAVWLREKWKHVA